MSDLPPCLTLEGLAPAYAGGSLTPLGMVEALLPRLRASDGLGIWISRVDDATLHAAAAALEALPATSRKTLPLFGIPFAVKDNIDVEGLPTTAGCPAYAYAPERAATAVQRLLAAGALLIGKTNLDQFATGLVGVRTPYGIARNPFAPDHVPGGSSSGSGVAVAMGLVALALGTDTAGSGRVPAGFGNIVGVKPTRGLIPTTGVVPACRSLDCVSVFAPTARSGFRALQVMAGTDGQDAYARIGADRPLPPWSELRVGVPGTAHQVFGSDEGYRSGFADALARLNELGATTVELDFEPFLETARFLYEGPWVAERDAAFGRFIASRPDEIWPVVRTIIGWAAGFSGTDTFKALYRLEGLRRAAEAQLAEVDILMVPTAPTCPRIDAVEADPIGLNSLLGTYTNFVNLLDLAGIAVPSGFTPQGLPFGVTFLAPAFGDAALAELGHAWQASSGLSLGATGASFDPAGAPPVATRPTRLPLAVVGAHLAGQPLNAELVAQGGVLARRCRTAPVYRLYALAGGLPARPGLVRIGPGGAAIELEVWTLPPAAFGQFVAAVPSPLSIGTVQLEDGGSVPGFLCEAIGTEGARDITSFGGWRAFRAAAG